MTDRKMRDIQSHFNTIIGEKINRYETAELLHGDGTWESWPDLPIRIFTDSGNIISISWSNFDDLWLTADLSLPFSIEGSAIRWVSNSIEKINAAVGGSIKQVVIGQGEMSIEGTEIEIWTRLLIQVDKGWLEICNVLDENGYNFHTEKPAGVFIQCN